MATLATILAGVTKFLTASDKAHAIVNGPASGTGSTVTVDSGVLPTFAKMQADGQIIGDSAPVNPVAGISQVETLSHSGNCSGSGTLVVNLVSTWLTRTYNVDITSGDTPSVWGPKIRAVLAADADFTNIFTIGGGLSTTTLTKTVPTGNDGTLNLALALGTASGVTAVPSSTNTTSGVAPVTGTTAPPNIRVASGFLYVRESGVWKKTALSNL